MARLTRLVALVSAELESQMNDRLPVRDGRWSGAKTRALIQAPALIASGVAYKGEFSSGSKEFSV